MTLQQLSDILKGFYALQGEAQSITRDDLAKFLVDNGIVIVNEESKPEFIIAANAYAERICNGEFPITYTREQVVRHTAEDYMAGASAFKNQVLAVLKENYEACKTLTPEDAARTAQEQVNETYEDLIAIFS